MAKIKTYAYKLYKAKRNKKLFAQIVAAGLTYNHCIALCKRYYSLFGQLHLLKEVGACECSHEQNR